MLFLNIRRPENFPDRLVTFGAFHVFKNWFWEIGSVVRALKSVAGLRPLTRRCPGTDIRGPR